MVSDSEFGDYLKQLRVDKKMTIMQLAQESGISASQISRIENGVRGIPKPDTIQKLSKALNVSSDEMMAYAGYMSRTMAMELMARDKIEIPEEWIDIVEDYKTKYNALATSRWNMLSAEEDVLAFHRKALHELEELEKKINECDDPIEVIKAINERNELEEFIQEMLELKKSHDSSIKTYDPSIMSRLPVLGTIRAGEPIDRIESNEGYTLVDPDLLRGREGFALRVQGDSMSGDRILEGDIVIVLKQEEVQAHEIAVVAVNGDEATLKRVKLHGNMVMLSPSNPAYEPQLLPAKDIHIIGKVVEVKFWPK